MQPEVMPDSIGIHPDGAQPVAVRVQKRDRPAAGVLAAPRAEFEHLWVGLGQLTHIDDRFSFTAADIYAGDQPAARIFYWSFLGATFCTLEPAQSHQRIFYLVRKLPA